MKGIILAGGTGSRLMPMTKVTNKHLLPIYDKPMIMYPLQTLIGAGIKDIMIVSGKGHAGHFLELLGSGKDYGVRLNYAVQENAGGIAEALFLTEDYSDGENLMVILGDNIYEDTFSVTDFEKGARIYLKEVNNADRFGVATIGKEGEVKKIVEKPEKPESNYAVTGLYIYDNTVFDKIRQIKPSDRGELEITDVNNKYIDEDSMEAGFVKGFWTDAGTVESLCKASILIRDKHAS